MEFCNILTFLYLVMRKGPIKKTH